MSGDFRRDAEAALMIARVLTAVWTLLTQAQLAAVAAEFAPTGVLPWGRLAGTATGCPPGWRRFLTPGAVRLFAGTQIVLALVMAVATSPAVVVTCLIFLIACQAGFTFVVGNWFIGGSDKIAMIVMTGTLVSTVGLILGDLGVVLAGVILVGGQLTVSYMVAGLSKVAIGGWRDGTRLRAILATRAWGGRIGAALVRLPGAAFACSWAVILLEALFPLALFAPEPVLMAALAAMLAFHGATAVLMGLNRFPWAFAAAYPACLLLGRVVRSAVGG